jgi:hypothetical protein
MPLGPEARHEQTKSISLAFVTAVQILPPRQLAVLIWHVGRAEAAGEGEECGVVTPPGGGDDGVLVRAG